jgi:hypothetical protein
VVAGLELRNWENWIAPEQHHAWGGWYWIWPYTLSAPANYSVAFLLVAGILVFVLCLPWKGRLLGFGLLVLLGGIYLFSSSGPGEARPWWEHPVSVPGGLTLQSPLIWMMAWLGWVGQRSFRRRLG